MITLSLDTAVASVKPADSQSTRYGDSQTEFISSVPTTKLQLLGERDFPAATEQLDLNVNRKPAG